MLLWWLSSERRRRHRRLAEAQKQLHDSRKQLQEDRRNIVVPARETDKRNHYSDLIRDALQMGYGHGGEQGGSGASGH